MALAKWYKIDFHTHSPASICFRDKSVSAEQWVMAAKEAGLDAVVLTDHNSVSFISEIESLDKKIKEGIKVFYGIELCLSADFAHVLMIFDDKFKIQEIEDIVICDLKLKREAWGDTTVSVSERDFENLCLSLRNRIIIIPAHFGSEKGLGTSNINAIKTYNAYAKFDAIEVRNEKDLSEYKNKVYNGAIGKVAMVTGSDNPSPDDQSIHSIKGFGTAFTWIKTSSLTFEGLRQVFLDPENRCINMLELQKFGLDYNPNEVSYNYIGGIKLSKISHLTDLDMRFSFGLNCIIGGRGTGKSTVVDAIKYGLNCGQELSDCELLNNTMQNDGQITTYYSFGLSKNYMINARREGRRLVFDYANDAGETKNPPEFKIDFYGQKEIYGLLEEDGNTISDEASPLVRMIDDRIQSKLFKHKEKINNVLNELVNYSSLYKINCKRVSELPKVKAEVEKAEAIIKSIKATGLEETREQGESLYKGIMDTKKNINSYSEYTHEVIEKMRSYRNHYGLSYARLNDDPKLHEGSIIAIKRILNSLDHIIDTLLEEDSNIKEIKNDYMSSQVHKDLIELQNKYLAALESASALKVKEIQITQDRLQENKELIIELESIVAGQSNLLDKIRELINKLVKYKIELSEIRRKAISEMHMERVEFRISTMAHLQRFKSNLQKEFKRDTYEDEFEKLASYILNNSNDFENLKNYIYFILTTETGDLDELGIPDLNLRFKQIWRLKHRNGTLESLINVMPEDKVDIRIVENGNSIDINEGSPGQKCAALLTFILNSGDNPLIIDQPEDDLDNSLIYNLVVQSIRRIKNKRQIIIVTHNPNIPVLGDAEGIVILERNADGKVDFRNKKKTGCIEEKTIREGICDIMEGGEEAFRKREAKYMYFS